MFRHGTWKPKAEAWETAWTLPESNDRGITPVKLGFVLAAHLSTMACLRSRILASTPVRGSLFWGAPFPSLSVLAASATH